MNQEKKSYLTTERAGFVVAGQRIPADYEAKPVRAKVGHELQLTDDEAEYELRHGTIEPRKDSRKKADRAAGDAA
jgi:hypothetical protein